MSKLFSEDEKQKVGASMTDYQVLETCPECGHEPVTEFLYGLRRNLPNTLMKELHAGKKTLAGCGFHEDGPAYGCLSCKWSVSVKNANHPMYLAMEDLRRKMDAKKED